MSKVDLRNKLSTNNLINIQILVIKMGDCCFLWDKKLVCWISMWKDKYSKANWSILPNLWFTLVNSFFWQNITKIQVPSACCNTQLCKEFEKLLIKAQKNTIPVIFSDRKWVPCYSLSELLKHGKINMVYWNLHSLFHSQNLKHKTKFSNHIQRLWLQTIASKLFNLCSKSHNAFRSYTHQSVF